MHCQTVYAHKHPVREATVYTNSALVKRVVTNIHVKHGQNAIRIKGLPKTLDADTIRMETPSKVNLLDISVRKGKMQRRHLAKTGAEDDDNDDDEDDDDSADDSDSETEDEDDDDVDFATYYKARKREKAKAAKLVAAATAKLAAAAATTKSYADAASAATHTKSSFATVEEVGSPVAFDAVGGDNAAAADDAEEERQWRKELAEAEALEKAMIESWENDPERIANNKAREIKRVSLKEEQKAIKSSIEGLDIEFGLLNKFSRNMVDMTDPVKVYGTTFKSVSTKEAMSSGDGPKVTPDTCFKTMVDVMSFYGTRGREIRKEIADKQIRDGQITAELAALDEEDAADKKTRPVAPKPRRKVRQQQQQHRVQQQQHRVQQLQKREAKRRGRALVECNIAKAVFESVGDQTVSLVISYVMNGPSWTPQYDVRASSDSATVEVTYMANIKQNTSEIWQDARIILSTAKPQVYSEPPEIKEWTVNLYKPPAISRISAPMPQSSAAIAAAASSALVTASAAPPKTGVLSRLSGVHAAQASQYQPVAYSAPDSSLQTVALYGGSLGSSSYYSPGYDDMIAASAVAASAQSSDNPYLAYFNANSNTPLTTDRGRPIVNPLPPPPPPPKIDSGLDALKKAAKVSKADQVKTAKVTQGVINATYEVPATVTVPSDNIPHKATIAVLELPAVFKHVARPCLTQDVFLSAKVRNSSDFTLLPGKSTVFLDNSLVNKTSFFDPIAAGDKIEISLGVDSSVSVSYPPAKTKKKVNGSWLSSVSASNRITEVASEQRIVIKNNKTKVPILIHVEEATPHTTDEEIKIKLLEPSPRHVSEADNANTASASTVSLSQLDSSVSQKTKTGGAFSRLFKDGNKDKDKSKTAKAADAGSIMSRESEPATLLSDLVDDDDDDDDDEGLELPITGTQKPYWSPDIKGVLHWVLGIAPGKSSTCTVKFEISWPTSERIEGIYV
ncbi:hypothetical protein GQ42DRAFT_160446 [Ramicandelaber brevisporus]|nr:hypothetical protein GQ42DRAFT_160446 [Ramicandelaber brevisporus]